MSSPAGEVFAGLLDRYEDNLGRQLLNDPNGDVTFYRGRRHQLLVLRSDLKELVERGREIALLAKVDAGADGKVEAKLRQHIADRVEE
jgi:hypothetical protein